MSQDSCNDSNTRLNEIISCNSKDCGDECIISPAAETIIEEAEILSRDAYDIVIRAKHLGDKVNEMNEKKSLFTLKDTNNGRIFLCKEVVHERNKEVKTDEQFKEASKEVIDSTTVELKEKINELTNDPTDVINDKEANLGLQNAVKELDNDSIQKHEFNSVNDSCGARPNRFASYSKEEAASSNKDTNIVSQTDESRNKENLIRQASASSMELNVALQCAEGMAKRTSELADNIQELITFSKTLNSTEEIAKSTKSILENSKKAAIQVNQENSNKISQLDIEKLPQTVMNNNFEGNSVQMQDPKLQKNYENNTKNKPTKMFSNAAVQVGLIQNYLKEKVSDINLSKRDVGFILCGFTIGCSIGYLFGTQTATYLLKDTKGHTATEEGSEINSLSTEEGSDNERKGWKLYYPHFQRKRRYSL